MTDGISIVSVAPHSAEVVIVQGSPEVISIVENALSGPRGPKGKKGDKGDSGAATVFVYNQNLPTTITEVIAHNLGHQPTIELVEKGTGARIILFDAYFPTLNTVFLEFLAPIAFTATMI